MSSSVVKELLQRLTLEEKVSLVSGADGWHTVGIERLGIGSVKTTDGPAGARGGLSVDGPKAALLPAPVLQAATWSKADLKELGRVLSRETKSKAAQVLLAPTICCIRNHLGGRNFESYSEDPFLSGSLAIEYVAGLQETGETMATVKHFVANEQEHRRFNVSAQIDEKALREIYLRPFELLIKSQTPPGCLMTAYNRVNGLHMDMNGRILDGILRNEWGFDGLVMSDWGGTNSTVESMIAGCDLEMPGPSLRRGEKLLAALEKDEAGQLRAALDASSARVLTLAEKLGKLHLSAEDMRASRQIPEQSSTSQEDCDTLRRVAASGMVLLKNDQNKLPLDPANLGGKRVAFLGPHAITGASNGGGSAAMNPQYLSQPVDSFKAALSNMGVQADVEVALGCLSHKWLPVLSDTQWSVPDQTNALVRIDFFASSDCTGEVVETQYRNNSSIDLFDSGPESLRDGGEPYSFRLTSNVVPRTSGSHSFSISNIGGARLSVNGTLLVDNSEWQGAGETFYSFGSPESITAMAMVAEQSYQVVVEARSKAKDHDEDTTASEADPMHCYGAQPSTRVGYLEEGRASIQQAVDLANQSDFAVVVVGLSEEWESEGYDRTTMKLPGKQSELVQTLLDNAKHPENIIIVNQSGSPVEMPWADQAQTILQAWYGGQEAGNALADVLLGVVSPEGRLPMSWPRRYEDLPFVEETWPGVDDVVQYKESTKVGYRWFHDAGVVPLYWFGFGLSYTTFSWPSPEINQLEDRWRISRKVRNTGGRAGSDIVQVYVWPSSKPAEKALVAFAKTANIEVDSERTIELEVRFRDLAAWADGRWVLEADLYTVGIGQHAGDSNMDTREMRLDATCSWEP